MDYKLSQNYIDCTDQEKKWFDEFYASRDIQVATYAAYKVSSDDSARKYGRAVSKREHIAALIQEFCSQYAPLPNIEELKRLYIDIANDPKSTQREKLMALNSYERLCGFVKKAAKTDDEEDDPLDDILD